MAEINKDVSNDEPNDFCRIKMNYLTQLKDSTKKLLYIIDEIQIKSQVLKPPLQCENVPKLPPNECPSKISDLTDSSALKKLEDQAKKLENDCIEKVDNDCSVFKRLTGICNCLNRKEFNDFMIHFNENSKYTTSNLGEIIKNVRILKKFLYMGSNYSNNALIFLNEGFTRCPHSEKVEMMVACSHADICNVFDDVSFVRVFLMWPSKYDSFGDDMTQMLAARVLYRIAVVEEGRRYLNLNSKVTNDIKVVIRKKSTELNKETLEFLNSTMNLLSPSIAPYINATYYCKADEGMTKKILNSLAHFRLYMTMDEILHSLDLLNKLSETVNGRKELRKHLQTIFNVFKIILMEYDNTQMNVLMTSILNNIMSRPKYDMYKIPSKTYMICDMSTEPIPVKHELLQIPSERRVKSKSGANIKHIKARDPIKVRRRAGELTANKNNSKAAPRPELENLDTQDSHDKATAKPKPYSNTENVDTQDSHDKSTPKPSPNINKPQKEDATVKNTKTSQNPIKNFREASKKSFKIFKKNSSYNFREASKKSFKVSKKNSANKFREESKKSFRNEKPREESNKSFKVLKISNPIPSPVIETPNDSESIPTDTEEENTEQS